jgi:hypothetical protein
MIDVKKQPFSFFFSGCDPDEYFNMVAKETNTMLSSYFYLMRKGKQTLKNRVTIRPDLQMIVDSGAHTFIVKEEYKDKPLSYWENYLEKYTKWARDNRDYVFAIVELDIDSLVGTVQVDKWREKYFEPLEKEGIQVIYVWHGVRGEKEWERMCKKYRYCGISLNEAAAGFDERKVARMFNIAKRYNTRLHGFAVSGKMMEEYPWYSCDSSTWLVGTQYGEVNHFDGRTMKRLKKDKWLKMKTKFERLGANWRLMERQDPYELQRVCMLTFLEYEKYIQRKNKSKFYWMTNAKKGLTNTLISVKSTQEEKKVAGIKFRKRNKDKPSVEKGKWPSIEWYKTDKEDWKEYCSALGIDARLDKEAAIDILSNFTVFCDFYKPSIDEITEEELYDLCDIFGLKDINTRQKALAALPNCFLEHARGERKEFNNYSEKEEFSIRKEPKEREEYVEDEDYVTVEITKKECDAILSGFLNAPDASMPEVEQYDEELRKANIEVVRNEKGHFVKGQQKIRKPKKIYSENMPKLACDTCTQGENCPKYQPGYVCAYNKQFKKFNTRSTDDIQDAMHSLVEANIGRLQRMMMFENMDGGIADQTVSQLIEMNMKYLNMLSQLDTLGKKITAQKRVVVGENGQTETVMTVTSNPSEGGILAKLFGNISNTLLKEEEEEEDFIEAEAEVKD